jgi:hypothetical protein
MHTFFKPDFPPVPKTANCQVDILGKVRVLVPMFTKDWLGWYR